MDDLDRAILLIHDPLSNPDPPLLSSATAFCAHLKTAPPSSLIPLSLNRLLLSPHPAVKFFCLQSLHDTIKLRHPSLSQNDLSLLRNSLISLPLPSSSPAFLKNKFSQTLAALIALEYPNPWNSPFLHLISSLPSSADLLSRVLISLDEDVISGRSAAAARLKDAMRGDCIPLIVRVWFELISRYRLMDPGLCVGVLDAMRRYVGWIDVGLVGNEEFVDLIFGLILDSGDGVGVRGAAAGCVAALFCKGMDPRGKLGVLRLLRMRRVLGDLGLVCRVSAMVVGYGLEVLECWTGLVLEEDEEGVCSAVELLEEVLPCVFYVMRDCDELECGKMVRFLSVYLSTVKSLSYIERILEVVYARILYDSAYRCNLNVPDEVGVEEEDRAAERRKEWSALFRRLCRMAPDSVELFVRNLIVSSLEMGAEEVEAALTLFCWMGETLSEERMKSKTGFLGQMLPMLLSAKFACHSHRLVALVYLETITKYMKFVQENCQYIPDLLAVFLDDRGIHHSNASVSRRASYLFMRAVKLLKAKLVPFIDMILQSVPDALVRYTALDWSSKDLQCCGSEDGSHVFEAIGLLIGMEDVLPEKQTEYLASLLKPLCQHVDAVLLVAKTEGLGEYSPKIMTLQQIIVALNALSKGFSERTVTASRPVIGVLFKQTLDALLQILALFPKIKPLRKKITSFIHRMVEILGTSVFPYLLTTFDQLLVDNEPNDIVDFLLLINQVVCKFGNSVASILEEIFPTIASRLFDILSNGGFSFGSECNTEEIRELQELQRMFYTFLHVLTTHDLSSVFLVPKSRSYLDAIMQLLLLTCCSYKDVLVRKMCVQIFIKLIKDWCNKYSDEEKVPGFGNFIVEKFATNCCLYSVLDKSLEFRDANTLVLLGEIVLAQKVMYEKLGDDFLVHFVSKGLVTAHCPHDLAEQYYTNVQGNDIKALKSFYLSMIENLRQLQNASLVFR